MTTKIVLNATRPVSIWNKELSISPKSFFTSLGKAAISGAFNDVKGIADNVFEALTNITKEEQAGHAAWLLIYLALEESLSELALKYHDLFSNDMNDLSQKKQCQELVEALESIDIGLNADFFLAPSKSVFLDDFEAPFNKWLLAMGMTKVDARIFYSRLRQRIVLSLHNQWLKNSSKYACINIAINSPFTQAEHTQRKWMQYRAWLKEQTHQRMFSEAFSLNNVYIPLRAYYQIESNVESDESSFVQHAMSRKKNKQTDTKRVVDLHTELNKWLINFDNDNAIKVISGGPGSGKSSFAKMFAAHVADKFEDIPIIFVPLHHFNVKDDLISSMEQFVREERYLSGSPLDASNGEQRLLIIFDGLDELAMQGKAADETARFFVDEVINKLERFNLQNCQRRVLITGRDIAVQSALDRLRKKQQILHILPYFVDLSDEAIKDQYQDPEKLLKQDQRSLWWKAYSKTKGLNYDGLPGELNTNQLVPITQEPLLNYLVALSFERGQIKFTNNTTLNAIYNDLLIAVHERKWSYGTHKGADYLAYDDFARVLEEIALAIWHGDGRTATVQQISNQIEHSNLNSHFDTFTKGTEEGVARLLTAFYFRQNKQNSNGEKTIEFTHKSFGEYLTALRIVRLSEQIRKKIVQNKNDPDEGWTEREALKKWIKLCGPSLMDAYVYDFLLNEFANKSIENLLGIQNSFAKLINMVILNAAPMEDLNLPTFKIALKHSANAEHSLTVIHHACAQHTASTSKITKNAPLVIGWLYRVQSQIGITSGIGSASFNFLSYLDLSNMDSSYIDLNFANLSKSVLDNTRLTYASLVYANLTYTSFKNANLAHANLASSDLSHANLSDANLSDANLSDANLSYANLKNINLKDTNLKGANLKGADLKRAYLLGYNLRNAILIGANLNDANLRNADLRNTDLRNADLRSADLRNADLSNADLRGVGFSNANLISANLNNSKLDLANLSSANLSNADLSNADLSNADLSDADLRGADLRGADLIGADLTRTNLTGAKGLKKK